MDYLNKVLGIQTKYDKTIIIGLPNFITSRYTLKPVMLDGHKAVFIYPKAELDQMKTTKAHISRISQDYPFPIVLILKRITTRQKEYLIKEKISFIVENRQIYLPFMAIYMQEKCDAEVLPTEKLLPSAQVLLLYFIYQGAKDLPASTAAKALNLTPMSISRASKQLEGLGIIGTKKVGVNKILYSSDRPKELFTKAWGILDNPVKKIIYIPRDYVKEELLESNILALSRHSMINEPSIKYYAAGSVAKWNDVLTHVLVDSDSQAAIEMWKYDPRILSKDQTVDVLSLALALKDEDDERIEGAVEAMMEELWRRING